MIIFPSTVGSLGLSQQCYPNVRKFKDHLSTTHIGVWLALALVRIRRERYILRPPKFVRMRVRVRIHTRPRHRQGVGERPHVRGSVERTASLALAKTRCRGGQTRWPWRGELSGLCKVYRPKSRPAEGAVLFRPIMWLYSASVVLGSTLHLALAIFQQGIPCFGHRPFIFCTFLLLYRPRAGIVQRTTVISLYVTPGIY